jgi:hypothetical protein
MRSNSLRTKQTDTNSTATAQGPKPGDFVLGSAESRAAARAIVQRPAEKDGPQPGDLVIDLGFLTPERAAKVYRVTFSVEKSERTPTGILDDSEMWIKWPEGFNPASLPDSTPPLTLENIPDDLLEDAVECYQEGFRRAKQNGQRLPPELDPDLVWNGIAYVPAEKPVSR